MSNNKKHTRADLAAAVQAAVPLSKARASRLVDDILKHMCQALSRHQHVMITRFGTFRVLHKGERMGRNPQTGEEKVISARYVLTFTPSATMRERVVKELEDH